MRTWRIHHWLPVSFLLLLGCTSNEEKAAFAAQQAADLLQQGIYGGACARIREALSYRDDVADYWLIKGRCELAQGQYSPAYVAYHSALEFDRGSVEALQQLAQISMISGREEEALEHAEQLLLIRPDDPTIGLIRGFVAYRRKQHPEALRLANEALAKNPEDETALVLKARALFEMGSRREAAMLLEQSQTGSGATKPKLDTLREFYEKAGAPGNLERTYARLMQLEPENSTLAVDYAKHLFRNGKTAEALAVVETLIQSDPPGASRQAKEIGIGMLSAKKGTIPKDQLRQLAEIGDSKLKLVFARVALENGYAETSVELVAPFAQGEVQPSNAAAVGLFATAHYRLGNKSLADRLSRSILEVDPNNGAALQLRALLSLEKGDAVQALRDAQILVRDQPKREDHRLLLARAYRAQKADKLEMLTLRDASRDFPKSGQIMRGYAEALARQGQLSSALTLAERFTSQNRNSAEGWKARQQLCRQAGDQRCLSETGKALAKFNA